MSQQKLDFPATRRNRNPIWEVLEGVLPDDGLVLEVASGSGQHAAYFAERAPQLEWQPSDPDPRHRASIAAWTAELDNVREPVDLDVHVQKWPIEDPSMILCVNMIHIAPWSACEALFVGAGRLLDAGQRLVLYGPYMLDGEHTAPSNARFDASLKQRDPSWGVRDLGRVADVGDDHGFELAERVDMPANNMTVVFERGVDG